MGHFWGNTRNSRPHLAIVRRLQVLDLQRLEHSTTLPNSDLKSADREVMRVRVPPQAPGPVASRPALTFVQKLSSGASVIPAQAGTQ
jgi:hypothetical protein